MRAQKSFDKFHLLHNTSTVKTVYVDNDALASDQGCHIKLTRNTWSKQLCTLMGWSSVVGMIWGWITVGGWCRVFFRNFWGAQKLNNLVPDSIFEVCDVGRGNLAISKLLAYKIHYFFCYLCSTRRWVALGFKNILCTNTPQCRAKHLGVQKTIRIETNVSEFCGNQ